MFLIHSSYISVYRSNFAMNEPLEHLFPGGLSCLLLSVLANACLLRHRIKRLQQRAPEVLDWMKRYRKTTIFACSVSLTNISALCLLYSQILGLHMFSAPFPRRQKLKIERDCLVSILFEDVPQFVVQITALSIVGKDIGSSNILIPFLFTIVSLVAGILRGFYFFFLVYSTSEKRQKAKGCDPETAAEFEADGSAKVELDEL